MFNAYGRIYRVWFAAYSRIQRVVYAATAIAWVLNSGIEEASSN